MDSAAAGNAAQIPLLKEANAHAFEHYQHRASPKRDVEMGRELCRTDTSLIFVEPKGISYLYYDFRKADVLSAMLGPLILLPYSLAFVTVLLAKDSATEHYLSIMLQMVVFMQCFGSLFFAFFSQLCVTVNVDIFVASFLTKIVEIMKSRGLEGVDLLHHTVALVGCFSFMFGFSCWILGRLKAGFILRFVPYTVSMAIFGGTGMLIADGALREVCKASMIELVTEPQPAAVYLTAAMVILAGIALNVVGKVWRSPVAVPLAVVVLTVVTRLIVHFTSLEQDELLANGFYLDIRPVRDFAHFDLYRESLESANFQLSNILNSETIPVLLSLDVVMVLCYSISIVITAEVCGKDEEPACSPDQELQLLGTANMLGGACGGAPVCHSFKIAHVMLEVGGRSRMWVLFLGAAWSLLYLYSPSMELLTLVPKFILGGLIFCMGMDIVLDACVASRHRVTREEWWTIVVGATTSYVDMLYGICLGLAVSFILFIVEYAHVSGVIRGASLQEVRSHVDRSEHDLTKLSQEGERVRIYWLTGYFFFGTAMTVCIDIQEQLVERQLKVLVLDFDTVPAVDASGVSALVNLVIKARRLGCKVCFSSVVRRLRAAIDNNLLHKGAEPMKYTGSIAHALAWAEEKVLHFTPPPTPFLHPEPPVLMCPLAHAFNISLTPALGPEDDGVPEMEAEHSAPKNAALTWLVHILGDQLKNEDKVVAALAKTAQVMRIAPHGIVFSAGRPSLYLFILVEGEVVQSQKVERSKPFVKLNSSHLNAAKHDHFAFEETTRVRKSRRIQAPNILNLVEFAAGADYPMTTTVKTEYHEAVVVGVPVKALQELGDADHHFGKVLNHWTSANLAATVLGLMAQQRVDPYREAVEKH